MVCICSLQLRVYPWTYNSVDKVEWSRLTDLYILYCVLDLGLKSLSVPEEVNCLTAWVKSKKSLKRKAYSSLLLFVLNSFPLWRSFRGPRQLVKELKTRFYIQAKMRFRLLLTWRCYLSTGGLDVTFPNWKSCTKHVNIACNIRNVH